MLAAAAMVVTACSGGAGDSASMPSGGEVTINESDGGDGSDSAAPAVDHVEALTAADLPARPSPTTKAPAGRGREEQRAQPSQPSQRPNGPLDGELLIHDDDWYSVVRMDGTGRRRLFDRGYSAQWSPDGSRVAFLREDGETANHSTFGLYVVDADTSKLHRLTEFFEDQPSSRPAALEWSPNGQTLVLQFGYTKIGPCSSSIIAVDAASGEQTRLTAGSCDYWPTWSPDSRRVAFHRHLGQSGIFVVDASGVGVPQQIPATDFGWGPEWSPDGSLISFILEGESYVISPDGTGRRKLAAKSSGWTSTITRWSPDGSHVLLHQGHQPDGTTDHHYRLLVLGSNGGTLRLLSGTSPRVWISGEWMTDGRHVMAVASRTVQVVPIDGSSEGTPLGFEADWVRVRPS